MLENRKARVGGAAPPLRLELGRATIVGVYTLKGGRLPSGPRLTFRDRDHLENSWVKVVCDQCGIHFSLGPAMAYPLLGDLAIVVPLSKVPMLEDHLTHRLRVEAKDARERVELDD